MDERRGSAQRIDSSRASLRQGMFFSHHIIINMEIDGDIMDVILNNQIKSGRPWSTSMSKVGEVVGLNLIRVTPKICPPKIK
jgi:hypothetical protein